MSGCFPKRLHFAFTKPVQTAVHRRRYYSSHSQSYDETLVKYSQFHEANENIFSITMNDLKTRNCLSSKMVDSLIYCIKNSSMLSRNQCRVLLINSNSKSNVFCSGHDLKSLLKCVETKDEDTWKQHFIMCSNLLLAIQDSEYPIIACIHGIVTASGLEIASATDLAICTKGTQFLIPGMNIGVNACKPATTFSQSLLNNGGTKLGLEMLLTGKETILDAQMAYDKGFVNAIADDYEHMNEIAFKYATQIASKSHKCVQIGKQMFYQHWKDSGKNISEVYDMCSECMVENMFSNDAKHGIECFLNKTIPKWTNS